MGAQGAGPVGNGSPAPVGGKKPPAVGNPKGGSRQTLGSEEKSGAQAPKNPTLERIKQERMEAEKQLDEALNEVRKRLKEMGFDEGTIEEIIEAARQDALNGNSEAWEKGKAGWIKVLEAIGKAKDKLAEMGEKMGAEYEKLKNAWRTYYDNLRKQRENEGFWNVFETAISVVLLVV